MVKEMEEMQPCRNEKAKEVRTVDRNKGRLCRRRNRGQVGNEGETGKERGYSGKLDDKSGDVTFQRFAGRPVIHRERGGTGYGREADDDGQTEFLEWEGRTRPRVMLNRRKKLDST